MATPLFSFRWPTGRKDRMRRLAEARGISITDALLEAEDIWCRREEDRQRTVQKAREGP